MGLFVLLVYSTLIYGKQSYDVLYFGLFTYRIAQHLPC